MYKREGWGPSLRAGLASVKLLLSAQPGYTEEGKFEPASAGAIVTEIGKAKNKEGASNFFLQNIDAHERLLLGEESSKYLSRVNFLLKEGIDIEHIVSNVYVDDLMSDFLHENVRAFRESYGPHISLAYPFVRRSGHGYYKSKYLPAIRSIAEHGFVLTGKRTPWVEVYMLEKREKDIPGITTAFLKFYRGINDPISAEKIIHFFEYKIFVHLNVLLNEQYHESLRWLVLFANENEWQQHSSIDSKMLTNTNAFKFQYKLLKQLKEKKIPYADVDRLIGSLGNVPGELFETEESIERLIGLYTLFENTYMFAAFIHEYHQLLIGDSAEKIFIGLRNSGKDFLVEMVNARIIKKISPDVSSLVKLLTSYENTRDGLMEHRIRMSTLSFFYSQICAIPSALEFFLNTPFPAGVMSDEEKERKLRISFRDGYFKSVYGVSLYSLNSIHRFDEFFRSSGNVYNETGYSQFLKSSHESRLYFGPVGKMNDFHTGEAARRLAVLRSYSPEQVFRMFILNGRDAYQSTAKLMYNGNSWSGSEREYSLVGKLMSRGEVLADLLLSEQVSSGDLGVFITVLVEKDLLRSFLKDLQPENTARQVFEKMLRSMKPGNFSDTDALVLTALMAESVPELLRLEVRKVVYAIHANTRDVSETARSISVLGRELVHRAPKDDFEREVKKTYDSEISTLKVYKTAQAGGFEKENGHDIFVHNQVQTFYDDRIERDGSPAPESAWDGHHSFRRTLGEYGFSVSWDSKTGVLRPIKNLKSGKESAYSFIDRGVYIEITTQNSSRSRRLVMYITKPDQSEDDIEKAINKIKGQRRIHSVVHGGHSYHAKKSLTSISDDTSLVVYRSCGGAVETPLAFEINRGVQVVGTEGVGMVDLNVPLLNAVNQHIIEGKDLIWSKEWERLGEKFASSSRLMQNWLSYKSPDMNQYLATLRLTQFLKESKTQK